jgi:DNA-binding NarL/FixJ family response regulator
MMIVGDADIRSQVRAALRGESGVSVIGELAAMQPRHVGFMAELQPEIVILDGTSRTINPLVAVAELRSLATPPRIIVVLPAGGSVDFRAASRLGAEAIVTTQQALRTAVLAPIHPDLHPERGLAA